MGCDGLVNLAGVLGLDFTLCIGHGIQGKCFPEIVEAFEHGIAELLFVDILTHLGENALLVVESVCTVAGNEICMHVLCGLVVGEGGSELLDERRIVFRSRLEVALHLFHERFLGGSADACHKGEGEN